MYKLKENSVYKIMKARFATNHFNESAKRAFIFIQNIKWKNTENGY